MGGRSAKVLHQHAVELQSHDDLNAALDYYVRSLEIFDDQALTDYCIARILIELNRFEEARQRFVKILNGHGIGFHDGNDFLWMTDLGYTLVKLGDYQTGAHWLSEGLRRMPAQCYAWNALGVAQAQSGQPQKAVESFGNGLQCDASSAVIWSNLATVYASASMLKEAIEALQQAAAINSSHPIVAHNAQVFTGQAHASAQPQFDLFIPKAR